MPVNQGGSMTFDLDRVCAAALLGAALAGCAPMTETQCRAITDWYQQGEQDALMGNRPKIEQYAQQCGVHQVKPAESDYLAGWAAGYSEWNRRVSGSKI
jgi:hypothetical protein